MLKNWIQALYEANCTQKKEKRIAFFFIDEPISSATCLYEGAGHFTEEGKNPPQREHQKFSYSYISLPWNSGACGPHLAVIHPWPWAPSTCTINTTRIKEMRCTEIDCNNTKSETSSHRKEIPGSDRQHPTSPQSSFDPVAQMVLQGAFWDERWQQCWAMFCTPCASQTCF